MAGAGCMAVLLVEGRVPVGRRVRHVRVLASQVAGLDGRWCMHMGKWPIAT